MSLRWLVIVLFLMAHSSDAQKCVVAQNTPLYRSPAQAIDISHLTFLDSGTTVYIINKFKDFYKIRFQNTIGFVSVHSTHCPNFAKSKKYTVKVYYRDLSKSLRGKLVDLAEHNISIASIRRSRGMVQPQAKSIPIDRIEELQFHSKKSVGKGAAWGALIGGVIMMAAVSLDDCAYCPQGAEVALAGALLGAMPGAIIGAFIGIIGSKVTIPIHGDPNTYLQRKKGMEKFINDDHGLKYE